MASRFPFGEVALGGIVLVFGGYIAVEIAGGGARTPGRPTLSAKDSIQIEQGYRQALRNARRSADETPWLAGVQLTRLREAELRARTSAQPAAIPDDTVRAVLGEADRRSYFHEMLEQNAGVVVRWPSRPDPIRVWIQPDSPERGFSTGLIGPARMAFITWNELALGVQFEFVEDSTDAEVHVTWNASLPRPEIGTTFRLSDPTGWLVVAHVQLSTAYDIHTVQNAARHEVGHVLGLGHSRDPNDMMAPETEGMQVHLTEADRHTAELVYRLPAGRVK
jgi:matrixin